MHAPFRVAKASDRLTRPFVKEYSSIFEHILENIQKICQLRPIANRHVRPSVHPSCPYTMSLSPYLSFMTTLGSI
jgi:hypothetical protein